MLNFRRKVRIETERMTLRLPQHNDWKAWAGLRAESATFLTQWEPVWAGDHLTRRAFTNRVYWAMRAEAQGTALPLLLMGLWAWRARLALILLLLKRLLLLLCLASPQFAAAGDVRRRGGRGGRSWGWSRGR